MKYQRDPEFHAYRRAVFYELFWWPGRQLTTGAERPPDICKCRTLVDTGTMFRAVVQYNPACTADYCYSRLRPRPVERYNQAPACTCLYGLRRVDGVPGRTPMDQYGRYGYRRWGTWAFKIHPRCPHHGDRNYGHGFFFEGREAVVFTVLDEDERGNR